MELVEGDTLRGPLPIAKALALAKQIAEALEAAHEKGIIHRDLKPGNIKVTPEGIVKVLDFGLAKAVAERSMPSGADSPTLTLRTTEAGLILGTVGYMSPEQAAGKPVDRRSDIWSFGVVLYELLTGKRLFDGETVTHTLADVVRAPIDLAVIEDHQARHLIGRCLDRNIKNRLQHIGEARIAIESYAPVQAQAIATVKSGWWPWAAGALALALAAVSLIHLRQTPPEQPVLTTSILPPDKATFRDTAISPDGKLLAFTVASAGRQQLWVRPLQSLTAQPLAGAEQAEFPFWSPDSRWIGFFAQGKLKKLKHRAVRCRLCATQAADGAPHGIRTA